MKQLKNLIRLLIEADQTPKVALTFTDPFIDRKKQMEEIAKETGRVLRLSGLRFISRSSRLNGAHTYSAINERNENVVLKIQPIDEIEGYRKVQRIASRLSPDVAIHLPTIYQIRPLQDLLHGPAAARLTGLDNLCAIVMERLEEIPGNLFDLITKPPKKSAQSLNALLNDHKSFKKLVSDVVERKSYDIIKILERHSVDKNTDAKVFLERLKTQLGLVSYSFDSREPDSFEEPKKVFVTAGSGLIEQIKKQVELWCIGAGIFNRTVQINISKNISDEFESKLNRRAIPKDPTSEKAGPLSNIKGVDKLMQAISKLSTYGIEPADLHGNNIMIRPGSGELVLADLGHFG